MNVQDVVTAIETLAPPQHAAEWDNVGLLLGSRSAEVRRALLTIDLTAAVLDEAIDARTEMIIAYHPVIFGPLKRVVEDDPSTRTIWRALQAGLSVYSPHTALDAAPGGVNDWLAAGVGEGEVTALETLEILPQTEQCKLVTFCPADATDAIRQGLAGAGAGRIGDYELCSFELRGEGTFHGGESTSPTVGRAGTLERVDEVRLEMVCARRDLADLVVILRETHPYEEPPIEIYALQPRPQRDAGMGRVVTLSEPTAVSTIVERLKPHLGVEHLQVAIPDLEPRSRVGCAPARVDHCWRRRCALGVICS